MANIITKQYIKRKTDRIRKTMAQAKTARHRFYLQQHVQTFCQADFTK